MKNFKGNGGWKSKEMKRKNEANHRAEEAELQTQSTNPNRTNKTRRISEEWTEHNYKRRTKHLQELGVAPSNRASEGESRVDMDASSRIVPFDAREIRNRERKAFQHVQENRKEVGPCLKRKAVS